MGNPPPSSHTPSVWCTLPRSAHRLYRTLLLTGPSRLADLAPAALLTHGPTATPQELRTAVAGLRALGVAQLVECSAEGIWSITGTGATPEVAQISARHRAKRTAKVTAERAVYRASGGSDWDLARAAASKAQRAQEKAWWAGLTPPERHARRVDWQHRYQRLSLAGQTRVKHDLATRRQAAGITETDHHGAWINSWTDQAWAERVAQRQATFRDRPHPIHRCGLRCDATSKASTHPSVL